MKLAVVKERRAFERRVAASPDTVKRMVGMGLEVGVRAHTDLEPLALGPLDERELPVGPTRRPRVPGEMVELDVADVRGVLRVGRARARDAPPLPRRLVEIAGRHRPLHRDVRAPGVEVRRREALLGQA